MCPVLKQSASLAAVVLASRTATVAPEATAMAKVALPDTVVPAGLVLAEELGVYASKGRQNPVRAAKARVVVRERQAAVVRVWDV